jgi:SAM-dependent methyltransferase
MSLGWIDVSNLSFNSLLLFESVQLSWMPGWQPERELAIALRANPAVDWYLRHKCPQISPWLDKVAAALPADLAATPAEIRQAELAVLQRLQDWLVYALDPASYDAQPFLAWDDQELLSLVDFRGKVVIDVGAGTGRLAFTAAPLAQVVYALEPVANIRAYLQQKARRLDLTNVYPADGLITAIPFPDGFADVVVSGHVYGDDPAGEYAEMRRVTRPGGMIILCPGNSDVDNDAHKFLVEEGFAWSRFEEPRDGWKRKYWKRVD